MNVRAALATTVLLAIIAAWFLLRSPEAITNYPSSGTDIVAFGDSLVSGVGASGGGGFVSRLSTKTGQPIVNLGVPGDTTASGLARIDELDKYKPKIVILLLGGNDYLRRIPREQTFANLSAIIGNIHSRGAIVVLLGVRGGLLVDHFDAEYEALSETFGTAHVTDVLDGLFGNSAYMSDEIHPNDAGYTIIADRIFPIIEPLLK
jgi:acyl-CoA thioesterase I